MNNEEKLISAFVAGLGIDAANTDWENLKYREIPEWDSVAHMQVIAEIEDVIAMSSYPTAREIVTKYDISF